MQRTRFSRTGRFNACAAAPQRPDLFAVLEASVHINAGLSSGFRAVRRSGAKAIESFGVASYSATYDCFAKLADFGAVRFRFSSA